VAPLFGCLDDYIACVFLPDNLIDKSFGNTDVLGGVDLQSAKKIILIGIVFNLCAVDLDGTPEFFDIATRIALARAIGISDKTVVDSCVGPVIRGNSVLPDITSILWV
jgi:hypothetical protein